MHKKALPLFVILLGILDPFNSNLALAAAPQPIEKSLRDFLKALDAGDRATAHKYAPAKDTRFPVVVFDYDGNNKPVMIEGVEADHKYLDAIFDFNEKEHIKLVSSLSNFQGGYHSPELGFATFLLTQTFPIGGKMQTSKFNVTTVMSYDAKESKWRIFHWHATLISSEDAGK